MRQTFRVFREADALLIRDKHRLTGAPAELQGLDEQGRWVVVCEDRRIKRDGVKNPTE
jgi:hypothetical protein